MITEMDANAQLIYYAATREMSGADAASALNTVRDGCEANSEAEIESLADVQHSEVDECSASAPGTIF